MQSNSCSILPSHFKKKELMSKFILLDLTPKDALENVLKLISKFRGIGFQDIFLENALLCVLI